MSLFENDEYRWRETFFVLFKEEKRPTVETVLESLGTLGGGYELAGAGPEGGQFESLTLVSPADFSGMDISYVAGEEIQDQIHELQEELDVNDLTPEERQRFDMLAGSTARFDIFHFEQLVPGSDEEEEFLDPGSLLLVLDTLASAVDGVGVDPQSGTLV